MCVCVLCEQDTSHSGAKQVLFPFDMINLMLTQAMDYFPDYQDRPLKYAVMVNLNQPDYIKKHLDY